MTAEEFLIKWRKENNTPLAIYSSYHIDAMEAYHKAKVEAISDEEIKDYADSMDRLYTHKLRIRQGAEWFKNKLLKHEIEAISTKNLNISDIIGFSKWLLKCDDMSNQNRYFYIEDKNDFIDDDRNRYTWEDMYKLYQK